MRPKILFCATVDYHFRAFHLPVMEWFQQMGWEVHVAARGTLVLPHTDQKFDLPIERSPLKRANLKAYRMLKAIIDKEGYDIIHCHTPMGGVLARLAARGARARGTKVIYTAHGFHFYKGAPLRNWLLYYPVERWLASRTDCLVTINEEDFGRARRADFRAGMIAHIHGVGVDTAYYAPIGEEEKRVRRERYGYSPDHFLLIYAAEFNANKNHRLLIYALAKLKAKAPTARLLLAGEGPLLHECRALATQLGVAHMVEFLGYRDDLDELYPMCDAAAASSLREGLPVNVMEAMACGLPVVATRNRGHNELVDEGRTGFIVEPDDVASFASRLQLLYFFRDSRRRMGERSAERAQRYSLEQVMGELGEMYLTFMMEASPGGAKDQYRRAYL
ncbi:glycosyltransferase family 4 protein [Paenibacillus sp. LHD-117]|uniref:glycosyltransferase family 4 protein n=1 Tax=Paenibacillus sp. LHD-117 TaxID=3071412 RepID=UPI0027E0D8EA|nr:glycosyltransferase family 4 protein [Paenibacillus sp. LHD-117]MDQ6423274.1 glycosyltransferase family 4 protein [Paenibacillus sp. LHD-117]